jgi:hypothetical protein
MKNLIPLTAAIAASFAIVIGGAVSTAAAESGNNAQVFYVALGDSVATGAQPAAAGAVNGFHSANGTNRGYVDVLYGVERDLIPNL